jgi:amino acid transporter
VINIVVGGSIFVMPAALSRDLGTAAPLAYFVGAAVMALVTFSFAEVARRTVASGGPYAYVEQAFGIFPGFLAGLLVWLAGMFASAAVAAALVDSLGKVAPVLHQPFARAATLVCMFAVLAAVNVLGVRSGIRLASAAAIAKFAGLVLFVGLATRLVVPENLDWEWPSDGTGLGRATILVIFAFAGMEVPLCAGGEIRDPDRTVPRALLAALVLVTVCTSPQLVAQGVLGGAIASSQAPLADAREDRPTGYVLLLATGAVSMFGYLAGDILGMSRILFALAASAAAAPNSRPCTATRGRTLRCSCTITATALSVSGTFTLLAPIASVAVLLLYIVLRRRAMLYLRPGAVTGRRRLAGTVVPVLAIVCSAGCSRTARCRSSWRSVSCSRSVRTLRNRAEPEPWGSSPAT